LDLQTVTDNNQDVFAAYKKTYNYRVGAEFKIDQISLRGGYGIQGNPYKNLSDASHATKIYSGGLGYRVKNYYADLCYQQVSTNASLKPYTLADGSAPTALITNKKTNIFLTFGIRF
jgi:long-subunit fatty acid transport protein